MKKLSPFKTFSVTLLLTSLTLVMGCERKDPNHPETITSSSIKSSQTFSDSVTSVAASSSSANSLTNSATNSSFDGVNAAEPANFATDAWVGQWTGPEGTFLKIDGDKGNYTLTIQTLDGPTTYSGSTLGDRIQFERNGVAEIIRTGNGKDTGMKWLDGKSNCLIIRDGEGFCRD